MKLHRVLLYFLVLLLPVQLGKHFWPDFSLVSGIRIDYLSPTFYLTDILILVIIGSWLLSVIANAVKQSHTRLPRRFAPRNDIVMVLVLFFLIINCLFAQNQGAAFYNLIKIIEFVSLGIYIVSIKYSVFSIQLPLSIAVIYSSLLAIAQFVKQGSLGGIFYWLGERTFNAGTPGIAKTIINGQLFLRPYATFPHPNALAGFLLIGLILSFPYWRKRKKTFSFFYFVLVASAIFLSFSRSVWLAGILVPLFFVILNRHSRESGNLYRFRVKPGMTVLIILMCLFTIFLINKSSTLFKGESFLQRIELGKAAIKMFQQSPLLGIGLNNFIVRLPEFQFNSGQVHLYQPVHNIYLLILAETGLVGFLLFLWFVELTYKRLLNCYMVTLLTALSCILFLGLFDHYWLTLQSTQLLFVIVLGFIWSKNSLNEVK